MSPSEEYEAMKVALVKEGFSETSITRRLNKPKREYTKNSNWKEEAKAIFEETGIITRSQIMTINGFPASSNPSQTVSRFIKNLEKDLDVKLTKQDRDTWVVDQDISKLANEVIKHLRGNGNRISKDKYSKRKSWSTVLARDVFKEVLSNDRFEEVSGGIIREAGA